MPDLKGRHLHGEKFRTATYKLAILMALIGRLWCGARLLATMSPVTTLSP